MMTYPRSLNGALVFFYLLVGCAKPPMATQVLLDDSSTFKLSQSVRPITVTRNTNSGCPSEKYVIQLGASSDSPSSVAYLEIQIEGSPQVGRSYKLTDPYTFNASSEGLQFSEAELLLQLGASPEDFRVTDPDLHKVAKAQIEFAQWGSEAAAPIQVHFSLEMKSGAQASGTIRGPLVVDVQTQCFVAY